MEKTTHTYHDLFLQLGLPSDKAWIEQFIRDHKPLEPEVKISEAPFWTDAQRDFLKKAIMEDADWAPMVDQLNAELH